MDSPLDSTYFSNQSDRLGKVIERIKNLKSRLKSETNPVAVDLTDQLNRHEKEGIILRLTLRFVAVAGSSSDVIIVDDDILSFLLNHTKLTFYFWRLHKSEKQDHELDEFFKQIDDL